MATQDAEVGIKNGEIREINSNLLYFEFALRLGLLLTSPFSSEEALGQPAREPQELPD